VCAAKAIVGLVAHEVAHFLLGHIGSSLTREQKEGEVDQAVLEWGFAEEAEAMKELWTFFRAPEQKGETAP
jgi:hypothetical protein